jgi:hypothetical protein
MKLREKKQIMADASDQRKQQIDEGVTLAKKVDAIRATLNIEEAQLEKLRRETLPELRDTIVSLDKEGDDLRAGNKMLFEERKKLMAPVDLTEAWENVRKEELRNTEKSNLLDERTQAISERESEIDSIEHDLQARTRAVERSEAGVNTNLMEAEQQNKEASEVLEKARHEAEMLLKQAETRERKAAQLESSLDERETYLVRREADALEKEIDLAKRERVLRDRYQMLERTLQRNKK